MGGPAINQAQNCSQLNQLDAYGADAKNLGKFGLFTDNLPGQYGQIATPTWWQFIETLYVVNRSGVTLPPGARVLFGGTEGIFKSVNALAPAGTPGDGVIPWTLTNGVPNGSCFNLIRKGPCKLIFDGVNVAIALGDRIGGSASGKAAKYGAFQLGSNADGTVITGDAAADAVSLSIPANGLVANKPWIAEFAGTCLATNSTDTLTNLAKVGGTTVGTTGAIDVANDDAFYCRLVITPRSIGATGVLEISGFIALKTTTIPIQKTISSIDTTAAIAVAINSDWSSASAGNQFKITRSKLGASVDSGSDGSVGDLPLAYALEAVAADAADDTLFRAMVDFTPIR